MREGRKKEASKGKHTNKAKQHSTPKAHVHVYTCSSDTRVRRGGEGRGRGGEGRGGEGRRERDDPFRG